jgi:uncharacterized protein YecE (DUF72 family)
VLLLGRQLGPICWQLPEALAYDGPRLDAFLADLPKTFGAAAAMAAEGEAEKLKHAPCAEIGGGVQGSAPLRHVLEARSPSFFQPQLYGQLETHGVALAISHLSGAPGGPPWPCVTRAIGSAGFLYARLHGTAGAYAGSYGPQLPAWAARLRRWRVAPPGPLPMDAPPPPLQGEAAGGEAAESVPPRDVFVFFNNSEQAAAAHDAIALIANMMEQPAALAPAAAPAQGRGKRGAAAAAAEPAGEAEAQEGEAEVAEQPAPKRRSVH